MNRSDRSAVPRGRGGALLGASAILILFYAADASSEPLEDSELRLGLDRLIEQIETLQEPDGDLTSLRKTVEAGVSAVQEEMNLLDLRLDEIRGRHARLAASPESRPVSDHWAYRSPIGPEVPDTRFRDRVRNPIDAFIFRRLEEEGLAPASEASKEQLIRRVSFDLIGLPPTVREVDRFLADDAPDAYERLVDRLLASPHFGERQAQFWLDLARTSDSCGYHIDTARPMWPYRDWVIQAFNRDLPFDRFTIEQLAGDLLPNPTHDQRVATGFHRNTMFNEEGGIDAEEFRVKAVVDRVGTTGTVWMGTSLACAECHDHKHDPISQREFFEMYAFFNTTADLGGGTFATRAPLIHLFEDDQENEIERLTQRIDEARKTLDTSTPEISMAQAEWERTMQRGLEWVPLSEATVDSTEGNRFSLSDDRFWTVTSETPSSTDAYRISGEWTGPPITAIRLEILPPTPGLSERPAGPGLGFPALSEIRLSTGPSESVEEPSPVRLRFPTWNTPNQKPDKVLDNRPRSAWILDSTEVEVFEAWFEVPGSAWTGDGNRFVIELEQHAGDDSTFSQFRISASTETGPIRLPPTEIQRILGLERGRPNSRRPAQGEVTLASLSTDSETSSRDASRRTFAQEEKLAEYFRSIAPALDPIREELAAIEKEKTEALKSVPTALVMGELEEPRETRIHLRGDFLRLGDPVAPGLPSALGGFPSDLPRNRLGLAEWLVRPDNPLTARVTVNRMWQQIFGRGIVPTSDDFGTQGEPPSHPGLLDWLAVEFVARGWSWKEMMRLIVTSSAYRQSSRVTPELLEIDPYNRLLARGPRFRLSAEGVRDNALATAGLLNRRIGGPSVFPWQPPGLWSEIGSAGYGVDDWTPSEGDDRFRRGLYTFWRRSNPYPSFVAFDVPTREYCTVKRTTTNTPLQALVALNDPVYLEAAAGFAARVLSENRDASNVERIQAAFRICTSRLPTERETESLIGLYERRRSHFDRDSTLADQSLFRAAEELRVVRAELAAWTILCQVLLNLDETLTKG